MNFFKTSLLLAAMTALFMGVGFLIGGEMGALIALGVAGVMNGIAFWSSDSLALKAHGAEPVTRASAPDLYQMVEELSANADLPTPRIYIIRTDQPNAFATGRSPEHGAVAVTEGLMRMLTREELAGVVAHELAHIKNRDTLIMTVAATIAGAISMLANFGLFFGGGGNNRGAAGGIALLVAVILAPVAASLVQMMISRTREYAADRLGAEICRHPLWLAGALAKISGQASRHEMMSAEANPASAHLFIVNPLSGRRMDNLFSTHPNTQNRIDALYEMAAAGGVAATPAVQRTRSSGGDRRGVGAWPQRTSRSSAPAAGPRRGAPSAGARLADRKPKDPENGGRGPWG